MDQKTGKREFTILLVDDRPENLFSLEEILNKEGRRFIKASSGNEALKQVLKNGNIGLIMLDVQMPGMDGFEVAKILKSGSKTKNISIIFVTAISKDQQFVLKGFQEGAVDYLQKPLDISVTQAKVDVFEKLYFYQQDLKETAKELERINRQLESFVHIVSHDLKSPLASIIISLSVMQDDPYVVANPVFQQKIDFIYVACNHLSEMISSILEYSKQSMAEQATEQVDTKELVQQIVFLLSPPNNIRVEIKDDLPVLTTKKSKLLQVFQNLVSNAIKYNDKEKGEIEVGAVDKGKYFEFYVKDNGPGITPEDKERIFRLFEVAGNKSNKDSSTGVGLNILKMLIEEQGGRIWIDSVPGEGSVFYFDWNK